MKWNSVKYISVFLCTFLACWTDQFTLMILIWIPLIGFSLFSGIRYFIVSLFASIVAMLHLYFKDTSYFMEQITFAMIACSLFFISHYVLLLLKCKLLTNYYVASINAVILSYASYCYINQYYDIKVILVELLVSILLILLFSFLIKDFSIHQRKIEKVDTKIIILLLVLFYLYLANLNEIPYIEFLLIEITLVILFLFALKNPLRDTLLLQTGLLLLFSYFKINISNENKTLLLFLPLLLSFFHCRIQILNGFEMFIVSTSYILLYVPNNFPPYFITYGIASFLVIFLPISKTKKITEFMYDNYKKSIHMIALQFYQFENMFTLLEKEFHQNRENRILSRAKEEVFDSICISCPKMERCHQKGKHLLLNYIKDALQDNLTTSKIEYIKNNCFKQEMYFQLLDKFTRTYLLNQYQNEEGSRIKKYLTDNFHSFSKIMHSCFLHFNKVQIMDGNKVYESLKKALGVYHYDVLFVNDMSCNNHYAFDIGIRYGKEKDIKNFILSRLEEILCCKMEITSIISSTLTYQYVIVHCKEKKIYSVKYAIKQNKEDASYCGDSYQVYDQTTLFSIGLSDGMGNGFEANEESNFTLNTLFSILKTKMNPIEGIGLTNELIHLKNDFESYTTLDFVTVDKQTLKATFYKLGAFTTYLIREHNVVDIENYALPLGIVEDIRIMPFEYTLKEKDILVICSDGMIDDTNTEIIEILEGMEYDSSISLCSSLFDHLLNIRKNNDDATLIIITINS